MMVGEDKKQGDTYHITLSHDTSSPHTPDVLHINLCNCRRQDAAPRKDHTTIEITLKLKL